MEGPRPWAQVFVGQQWVHEADGTATTFNRILTFLTSAPKDDMLQGQKTEGDVKDFEPFGVSYNLDIHL